MFKLEELEEAIVAGDSAAAYMLSGEALGASVSAEDILNKGLIPGLQKVGEFFETGKYFLPELVVSGDAVAKVLELLAPRLGKETGRFTGRFLIGTVQGDVHDLGKDIVVMMLRGNGWDVTDLGVDVPPEEFCSAVAGGDFQILGLSSLLTMTMPNTGRTIDALKEAGLRDRIKVIVGGAPTSPEWARRVGADTYAKDAPQAARVALALLGKS